MKSHDYPKCEFLDLQTYLRVNNVICIGMGLGYSVTNLDIEIIHMINTG